MHLLATDQPQAIPGTAVGNKYLVQNQSTRSLLKVLGATSVPAQDAQAFRVGYDKMLGVELTEPGESIYCWTDDPGGLALVVAFEHS